MRTWGPSGAGAAIRRAQAVSRLARQAGCGVDEAADLMDQPVTRRAALGLAGTAAAAGLGAALPRRREAASTPRHAPRVVIVCIPSGISKRSNG